MTHERASSLRELADSVGIVPEYLDQTGKELRVTSDDTRRAILAAMGIDASTDEGAAASLHAIHDEERRRLLAPARVVEASDPEATTLRILSLPPQVVSRHASWRLEVTEESGLRHAADGECVPGERVAIALPPGLPLGYHHLALELRAGSEEWRAEQSLILAPSRCVAPSQLLGDGRKAFGLVSNLYTLRSERNWGVGDLTDLGMLARWAGSIGAAFIGVNPLHALLNRGTEISPYSPVSRLFRNTVYVDVEAVPELRYAPHVQARLSRPELHAELSRLRQAPRVDYERVMELKTPMLQALHRTFVEGPADGERARAYGEFVRAQDPELTEFATFLAIGDVAGNGSWNWRAWPAGLQDCRSHEVTRFQREYADRIDYHRWLQFETDRQLGAAAREASRAGLAIGLYQDLAIGTSPVGSDSWSMPDLFVTRASIGAAPDPYCATGQNWGLPPIDPRALARNCYRYFIRLLRSGFRDAGALRIDHAMGLFRLFWIPEGMTGERGAYVRYPSADLLGILALESVRHNALVVGEDLGTVPEEVPAAFERWGILSSKVLYFERDHHGGFKPAEHYAELALATANTHDMPTIAGFWKGRDIELRRQVGLIADEAAEDVTRRERNEDKRALVRRLHEAGTLTEAQIVDDAPDSVAVRAAVHEFLCASPSVLVGLSLDDLAGEVEPVNQPGVGADKYPSWTRKMTVPLEDLPAKARAVLTCRRASASAAKGASP